MGRICAVEPKATAKEAEAAKASAARDPCKEEEEEGSEVGSGNTGSEDELEEEGGFESRSVSFRATTASLPTRKSRISSTFSRVVTRRVGSGKRRRVIVYSIKDVDPHRAGSKLRSHKFRSHTVN